LLFQTSEPFICVLVFFIPLSYRDLKRFVQGDAKKVWREEDSQEEGERIEEGDERGTAQVYAIAARYGEDSTGGLGHDVCCEGQEGPEEGLP
jgi:hypothetical protein